MKKILIALCFPAGLVFLITTCVRATIEPRLDADSIPAEAAAAPPVEYGDAIDEGRRLARAFVADENLSGLSVAVAVGGGIVWAEGFGYADYQNRTPVTPSTRFRIGRVTEKITAAAAGLLHERGRLDLDAPVQRYVPSFPEKQWPVSMRPLLGHAAGVRNQRGEREELRRTACEDDAEKLAIFADDPLLFQPGTRYRYSAYGYVLAGAVVATAAGVPWSTYVRREILDPLGMRDTVVDQVGDADPKLAHLYWPRMACDPRSGLDEAPKVDLSCIRPAAGLLSTPSDLVRFGSAVIEGGLLGGETAALVEATDRGESDYPPESGLGWLVRRVLTGRGESSTRAVCRPDGVPGGSTSLKIAPGSGIAVAVATNVTFADVGSLAARLEDLFVRGPATPRSSTGDSGEGSLRAEWEPASAATLRADAPAGAGALHSLGL